jgi:hypothetical protein
MQFQEKNTCRCLNNLSVDVPNPASAMFTPIWLWDEMFVVPPKLLQTVK